MIEFHINRGSLLPVLRMELILDGRFDFKNNIFNNAIQDSTVTFSMKDTETGIFKILNAKSNIKLANTGGCEERYIIEYQWKKRDIAKPGIYDGMFEITFNGNITENGVDYPEGNLRVPIQEELKIYVQ